MMGVLKPRQYESDLNSMWNEWCTRVLEAKLEVEYSIVNGGSEGDCQALSINQPEQQHLGPVVRAT
jgi:hypothetical protein